MRLLLASLLLATAMPALAQEKKAEGPAPKSHKDAMIAEAEADWVKPPVEEVSAVSHGSVTVRAEKIAYTATAGTLTIRDNDGKPIASVFYTAYTKDGGGNRPVTFFYNGGPGSATIWLHMGSLSPVRINTTTPDYVHPAPYNFGPNPNSLIDKSDLVFIDAIGAGWSRPLGDKTGKDFWGVDQDADAFARAITRYIDKNNRWTSPKFLFGESYGTPRSAVLVNELAAGDNIDMNGVVLLSQILDFNLFAGLQQANPGNVEGYVVQVPTFAATAWYHNHLPAGRPAELEPFLAEVEKFATTDYAAALAQGSEIDPKTKQAVAERLSRYIGLPASFILKADLRIDGPTFSKHLLEDQGLTTGRLDSRFAGPDLDPLSKDAEYDPMDAAISSAYVTAFNAYARDTLNWGHDQEFKTAINAFPVWDWSHSPPGQPFAFKMVGTSVMGDIANAMKMNPGLKVLVAGGYYDLGTPFYQGWYEMHHLPVPAALQANIDYRYYPSGHMVYSHEESLRKLHDDVAAFIRRNSGEQAVDFRLYGEKVEKRRGAK